MNVQPVIEQTKKGIANAQRKYKELSEYWLGDAPEYFATTKIAEAVHRLPTVGYVVLESNVRSALIDAGGNLKGKPNNKLPFSGRFDIAIWNKSAPRGLIEVKTRVTGFHNLRPDIDKLCAALTKADEIKWALVGYFLSRGGPSNMNARDQVKVMSNQILDKAADHVDSSKFSLTGHTSSIRMAENGAWTVCVLQIART